MTHHGQEKYKSKLMINRITCRVEQCKSEMNEQSYREHLEKIMSCQEET
jgi:hypothetical protein